MTQGQGARRPGRRRYGLGCVLACWLAAPAAASPASDTAPAEPRAVTPGPLAAAAAVVPGLVLHGAGHFVAGDTRTARRLIVVEGIALGTVAASGAVLGLSGASRRLSVPAVPLLIAGSGALLTTWAADLYGAAGGPHIAGSPPRRVPGLESRLGYLYVHDPQFDYAHFADVSAILRRGAWRAGARGQLAVDDDNQRVRASLAYRFAGPRRRGRARDGTALDVEGALTWHRYGSDGFASVTGELLAAGRYDLMRLSPTMAGAFAELSLGLGLEVTAYEDSADALDRLLAGIGFGVYLGTPGAVHGEVRLGYDHRRDGLAGGLAVPGGGNGFLGSFGIDGSLMLSPRWGVAASLWAGSAYLGGASLIYRRP